MRAPNLREHGAMLRVRVHEVPRARPHQDEDRNRQPGHTVAQQLDIGSGSSVGKIGAQLDAVRTTFDCRERGVERLNGGLDENGHGRKVILVPQNMRLIAVILFWCTCPLAAQSVRIQVVDVGQGDGILVRTPHHQWVLIDAGPTRFLADSLGPQFGVSRLALVIVSHRHADHYATIERILRSIPVDRFVGNLADCPQRTTDDRIRAALGERNIPAQSVGADTLSVDGVRFIILPPDPVADRCPDDENDNSIMVRVEYGSFSMLLTGDAEDATRDWLVASHPPLLDVRVLKASHHGSCNGTSASWLAAVTPQAVVISAGVDASYRHPMPEAVSAYRSATNGRVYCTNRHGTIRIYGYQDGHFTIQRQFASTKSCTYDGTHY